MATYTTMPNGRVRALIRRAGHRSQCRTFPTLTKARAWARPIEDAIEDGTRANDVVDAGHTVGELIATYRDARDITRPVRDTTTEHYTLRNLDKLLGAVPVARLTPDELVGYARQRRDAGAGPYTINMDISKLGTVLRYAAVILGHAPVEAVNNARPLLKHLGLIGGGGKRERRPTEEELILIEERMKLGRGKMFADIVRFAVLTAMRQGEITRIRWADVDHEKRLVLIRDRKDPRNKTGNDEWVPLLGDAWTILQAQPKTDERVFPIGASTVSKYFTEVCSELAIPDLHFHDLRHDGTSRLFEQGYKIEEVAVVTGHKSWNNLKRYTQLKPESLHR